MQTWDLARSRQIAPPSQPLLENEASTRSGNIVSKRPRTLKIALDAYHAEGISVFFRGLGICSARAFVVNAVQWAVRISFSRVTKPLTTDMKAGLRMDDESAGWMNLLPSPLLIDSMQPKLAIKS